LKDSTKNEEIGKVIWHSLNELGESHFYDVRFKRGVVRNIPKSELITVHEQQHSHEVTEDDTEDDTEDLDDIGLDIEKDAAKL